MCTVSQLFADFSVNDCEFSRAFSNIFSFLSSKSVLRSLSPTRPISTSCRSVNLQLYYVTWLLEIYFNVLCNGRWRESKKWRCKTACADVVLFACFSPFYQQFSAIAIPRWPHSLWFTRESPSARVRSRANSRKSFSEMKERMRHPSIWHNSWDNTIISM